MIGRYIRLTFLIVGALTVTTIAAAAVAVTLLSAWLQYEDAPAKAEYIIALAGDDHRLLKAIELYVEGYAPKILLSNDRVHPPTRFGELMVKLGYPSIDPRELRARVLQHFNVSKGAVAEFGDGHVSTAEEAEALKMFIGDRAFTAILVTSPFHARRAKITFESVLPRARFLVVSPPENRIEPRWWRDRQSSLFVVTESAKLLHFWLGGVFRRPNAKNGPILILS